MAFSRPLGDDQSPFAPSSEQLFCRFCGKDVLEGSFFNLRKNDTYYAQTITKLGYMNIRAERNSNLNVCHPCYVSFNSAYNFCRNYNRTQLQLANIDVTEAEKAKKNENSGPIKTVLDNIKTEPESADEIDPGCNDDLPSSYNISKNPIVDSNKSWRSYTWTCCHCDAEYRDLSALRSHSKKKHGVCFAFECPDCDIKLNEYFTFIAHLRNHKENLRSYCDVCDKPFGDQRYHNHVGDKTMCRYCGEILPDDSSRSFHQKTYKKRRIADYKNGKKIDYIITVPDLQFGTAYPDCDVFQSWKDYVWVCNLCEIKFHSTQAIRDHGEAVHGTCFTMKCLDCDATADSFHMLILHIMRHRSSLRHFCPFCDRLAHSDELFRAHVRKHLTNSSYCIECGQNYPNRITQASQGDITSVFWFLEPAGSNESSDQVVEPVETMDTVRETNEASEEDATTNDEENVEQEGNGEEKRRDEGTGENDSSDEGTDEDGSSDEGTDEDGSSDEGTDEDDSSDEGTDNEGTNDEGVGFNDKKYAETVDNNLPCPTSCASCNETFTDKRLYREHTNTTYCPICDKAYNCVIDHKYHLFSRHMAVKPYECYKCGKCYRNRNRAYTCMESHLAAKTKLCNICHSMVLKSFLKEHVETHKYDHGPYEKVCGYGYCKLKFDSWAERVNHRHSKHLALTYRKIRNYRHYRTQRDILGLLPMEKLSKKSK